jgi:hypothetical protein
MWAKSSHTFLLKLEDKYKFRKTAQGDRCLLLET